MRLIDADGLLKEFNNLEGSTNVLEWVLNEVIPDVIQKQPTSYDVDKVVKQLEENSVMRANSKAFYNNPQKGKYVDEVVLLNKAIEIVKGGVNYDSICSRFE